MKKDSGGKKGVRWNVAVNIRNVPEDVRRRFKSRCADAGVTMEAALLGYMASVAAGTTQPTLRSR